MTNEEYENLKKDYELQSLKNQLDREKIELKPRWGNRLLNIFEKNIGLIALLIPVLAGMWSFIQPIKEYLDNRQKQLHYELSENMIALANDLSLDSAVEKQQDAALLLSYYDLNSMPILLYKLETFEHSADKDKIVINNVITAINMVYMRNRARVTDEIINYIINTFKQTNSEAKWDDTKYNSLMNFGELINKISFYNRDRNRILDMTSQLKKSIEQDPYLKEKMDGFNVLLSKF